ncbi:hypothetical protein BFR06_05775 [Burkholderia pseudomallei]|nr:hypothetical protein BFR05_05765 [Burkholderia pseudomallei]APF97433.1 hypothetical protein BFR06_05775 [Burkholderia pseudomallei]
MRGVAGLRSPGAGPASIQDASIVPRARRLAASAHAPGPGHGRRAGGSADRRRAVSRVYLSAVATVAQFDPDRLFETRTAHRTGAKCRSDAASRPRVAGPALLFIVHEAR